MDRQKIKGSSNITEIGYDYDNMTLEIKFLNGKIYKYWPITDAGWQGIMKAESKGTYFAKHIRSNPGINYQRVDPIEGDSK